MTGEMTMQGSVMQKGIGEIESGDLVIPVIGIPFKGPINGNLDLHGDYFDKSTDLGPLETVMVFWDHGHDELYMRSEMKNLGLTDAQIESFGKDFGFGRQHIGIAQRGEITEEGVIYNVILNRRTKYRQVLARAAKNDLLSVSSKALHRVDDPENPGRIKYWAVGAIDFTPTPANPEAKLLLKSLMEDDMQSEVEEVVVQDAPAAASETPAEQPPAQTPITDAIRAVEQAADPVSEAEPAAESSEPEPEQKAVTLESDLAKSIGERMDALEEKFNAAIAALTKSFEERIASMDANTSKAVKDLNADLQIALPELARQITSNLKGEVRKEVSKSRVETQIETEKSAAPATAVTRLHSPEVAAVISNWPGR
jgi:hypothetical protein